MAIEEMKKYKNFYNYIKRKYKECQSMDFGEKKNLMEL